MDKTEKKPSTDHTKPENNPKIPKNMPKMRVIFSKNQKNTQFEELLKNFEVSIETKDLIDLGIDIWRMEQRLNKVIDSLPENSQDLLKNSVQKIKRYLDKNEIEIVDYTNQKFNEGRNLDVLAVEKSSNITEPIVKETKEPTILYKNQVVRKGKVIILENNDEESRNE